MRMRRNITYILIGVGVLLALTGLLKILPGITGAGLALCFFGLLLFGLSFISLPQAGPDAPEPMSAFERTAGVFYQPTRVFQNLRSHPRWLVALLLISLVSVTYTIAFTKRITPERIVGYTMEKLVESGWVPADKAEPMKQEQIADAKSPVKQAGGLITTVVGVFVLMAFIAALSLLIILMFGGRINFWQALSVVIHAALPVVILSKLLSLVLLYVKSPDDIHPLIGAETLVQDNLGALFTPGEHPVLWAAATFIGVLSFYGLWLRAIGLKHGGEKVSGSTAWTTTLVLFGLTLVLVVIWTSLFPGFLG
jgi:magnesium-transporting ATPase (P-type)